MTKEQENNVGTPAEELNGVIKSFYPVVLLRKIYFSISMFMEKDLLSYAAGGAFYFLFSIIPLVLFFVLVLDSRLADYGKISEYFFDLLGSFNQRINKEFFEQIGLLGDSGKSFFGVLGVVGLIWSSRSVFSSLTSAFVLIFKSSSTRSFLIGSMISFIFVPLVFAACVVFFLAGAVIKHLGELFYKIGVPYFDSPSAVQMLTDFATFAMLFMITFCMYRFLPPRRPKSADAFTGAVLFTVAAVVVQQGFASVISIANYYLVYGVISVLIAGLFWIYVLFALFYLFAQFVYVQSNFVSLELILFFTKIAQGKANFVERLLFTSPDMADKEFGQVYNAGQTIFKRGEIAENIYIIRYGSAVLEKTDENGAISTALVSINEMFGEHSMLSSSDYDKSAYAKTDAFILKIPKRRYRILASLDPLFTASVLSSIVSHTYTKEDSEPPHGDSSPQA